MTTRWWECIGKRWLRLQQAAREAQQVFWRRWAALKSAHCTNHCTNTNVDFQDIRKYAYFLNAYFCICHSGEFCPQLRPAHCTHHCTNHDTERSTNKNICNEMQNNIFHFSEWGSSDAPNHNLQFRTQPFYIFLHKNYHWDEQLQWAPSSVKLCPKLRPLEGPASFYHLLL